MRRSQSTLSDLWIQELRDLYNAEYQIIKALPKMAKNATTDELRQAFEEHLEQTRGQVQRLEQVFELIGQPPKGKRCAGMQGIIEEGNEGAAEIQEGPLLDAALIATAQRVEHYEIAAYGTVRAYAEQLGEHDCAQLLEQTLEEEKMTDERLTEIATRVNVEAESSSDEESPRSSHGNGSRTRRPAASGRRRTRS